MEGQYPLVQVSMVGRRRWNAARVGRALCVGCNNARAMVLLAVMACSADAVDGTSQTTQGGGGAATTANGGGGSTGGSTGGGDAEGRYFPADAWMYQKITNAPLHPDSAAMTSWLTDEGGWGTGEMRVDFSIEVLDAPPGTTLASFEPSDDFYSPDCDLVDVPLPEGGALEGEEGYVCTGDGDCHLIVVDATTDRLFEMWRADIQGGTFSGGCLAAWDMTRVYPPEGRGEQCSSADAAGFPIAPLLFTADEVAAGEIAHAIRFILPNARMRAGYYVRPASHAGGPSGPALAPVYGSRWRLKASFDLDQLSAGARVVARAMQEYGMVLADGGSIALTAQSDRSTASTWDGLLGSSDLAAIQPSDFEVIDTGANIELTYDCVRTAY